MHSSFGIALIFCAAWVAISKHGIIGPFWFENANQEPVTVRKERYIEVLNKLWGALGLLSRGGGRNRVGCRETYNGSSRMGHLPTQLILLLTGWITSFRTGSSAENASRNGPPIPRILTPPDFYLWGFLKDNVYRNNPQTIPELKEAITQKINAIPKEECIRVINNFARRIQICLQQNGGHLEHIL